MTQGANKVSILINCDCNAEILEITYWRDDKPRIYFFTIYRNSFSKGFWWRLKQAWKYFRYGEFEGNSICLQECDYNKFIDVLIEHKPNTYGGKNDIIKN